MANDDSQPEKKPDVDFLKRLLAGDQAEAGISDWTRQLAIIYRGLVANGFTDDQAILLTSTAMTEAMRWGFEHPAK